VKGDFTRGFNPDRKRGRDYRRISLQQGRLLLDSDFNASIDAQDWLIREIAADLGCRAGSPDLGFLVTQGALLALFDPLARIDVDTTNIEAVRDYGRKVLDRYPSLRLRATAGAGTARIPFRMALSGAVQIDLWVRADVATSVTVTGGGAVAVPAQQDFALRTVTLTNANQIEIALDPAETIWIGRIETHLAAGLVPAFSVAGGRYYVEGLSAETAEGQWPGVSFPAAAGFQTGSLAFPDGAGGTRPPAAGDMIVAYLEAGERHITAIEDPGLLEQALGGQIDTCTRTSDLGQVKLAPANGLTPAQVSACFGMRFHGTGTLTIDTPPVVDDPDPCALPVAGGYTGRDNRLYRFEVYRGGPLSSLVINWSRDNGAELFAVDSLSSTQMHVPVDSGLADGDLVELLSETIELGDAGLATLDSGNRRFTAPMRAVGDLVRLREEDAGPGATDRVFSFRDRADEALGFPIDPGRYGTPDPVTLKARRWHGTVEPGAAPAPFSTELEDGLRVTLDGAGFEPGDYWQYEARVRRDNANGPWKAAPHGPERLFAPLGLFQHQGPAQPLLLTAWLDERFPHLCSIDADDVAFDGGKIGSESDTVQEVIEELWIRDTGGCCEVTLRPSGGDDAAKIREAMTAHPNVSLVICLKKGIYRFDSTVDVGGVRVEVDGCPEAVIEVRSERPAFSVTQGGRLILKNLRVLAPSEKGESAVLLVDESAGLLSAEDCVVLNLSRDKGAAAVIVDKLFDLDSMLDPMSQPPEARTPFILKLPALRFTRSTLLGTQAIAGAGGQELTLDGAFCGGVTAGVALRAVGNLQADDGAILAGLDFKILDGFTLERLLHEGEALLDRSPETLWTVPNTGIGLAIETVLSGEIRDLQVVGGTAIALATVTNLTVDTLRLQAHTYGIFIKRAENLRIEGLRAALLSDPSRCIQIVHSAYRVEIVGSELHTPPAGAGVVLGFADEQGGTLASNLSTISVEDCVINAGVGVQLGGQKADWFTGAMRGLVVRGNQITAGVIGVCLRGPPLEPPPTWIVDALIHDNSIKARKGIDIRGASFIVQDNKIMPQADKEHAGGIAAFLSRELVVRGNEIDLRPAKGPAAIELQVCNGALVTGNEVKVAGSAALSVFNMVDLTVVANRLNGQSVEIKQAYNLNVSGNEINGIVNIDGTGDGTIRGNKVGAIKVTNATADWVISENRALFGIEFYPRADIVFGGFSETTFELTPVNDAVRVIAALNRMAIGDLTAASNIAAAVPAGGIAATSNATEFTSRSEASAFLMGVSDFKNQLSAALTSDVTRTFENEIVTRLPPEVLWPPRVAVLVNEQQIDVQAVGNRSGSLIIGNLGGAEVPEKNSVAQVIANRVDGELYVRAYPKRHVSQNVAAKYPAWITPSASPIQVDNLIT
jgi:hypothetical protein